MTHIKVYTPNENGKIEFTKEELEKEFQKIYDEGYWDGKNFNYTITYGNTTPNSRPWWEKTSITCTTTNDNKVLL